MKVRWWWTSLLPLSSFASLHCFFFMTQFPNVTPTSTNWSTNLVADIRYILLWTKKNVVRFYWAFWMVCIQNISCFLFSPKSTFRLNAFMEFGSKREHLWSHNTSIKCIWLTTNVDWHQNKCIIDTKNWNFSHLVQPKKLIENIF